MDKYELARKVFEKGFDSHYNSILEVKLGEHVATVNFWFTVACICIAVTILVIPTVVRFSESESAIKSTQWYGLAAELHEIGLGLASVSGGTAPPELVNRYLAIEARIRGIEASEVQVPKHMRRLELEALKDTYRRVYGVETREAAAALKDSHPEFWKQIHYVVREGK